MRHGPTAELRSDPHAPVPQHDPLRGAWGHYYSVRMSTGSLAVVEAWTQAVNARDAARVRELSADQIEVLGPRGAGPIASEDLATWMTRSGFSATPLRWYCGRDGTVVVEQAARWEDSMTGAEQGTAVVASDFRVGGGLVTRVGRHDDLLAALDAAGLAPWDEVVARR